MRIGFVASKGGATRHTSQRFPARKAQQASTIVEVVVATVIIAIAGAGVITSVNYGLFIMQMARENARASQIMLERLESVRLYNWAEVTNAGYVPTTFTDVYDPQAATNSQGAVYSGTLTVADPVFSSTSPSYSTSMRQFTVNLQWTTNGKVPHNRSLTTYVAKDGLQNYVY